jgi:hypothetical protein
LQSTTNQVTTTTTMFVHRYVFATVVAAKVLFTMPSTTTIFLQLKLSLTKQYQNTNQYLLVITLVVFGNRLK